MSDLACVDASLDARARIPARVRQRGAKGRVLPGVLHGMTQALDIVALHQTHGAGIKIGPYRFSAVSLCGDCQFVRNVVQRLAPTDRSIRRDTDAFFAGSPEWSKQAIRMMHAFGIPRHLGANHARRVRIPLGPVDPANGVFVNAFDLQRTGTRTVMRAGGVNAFGHGC